jgi:hypothetical protein
METDSEEDLWGRLQVEILEDARKVYSQKVMELWIIPKNWGIIDFGPDRSRHPAKSRMDPNLSFLNVFANLNV